MSGAVPIAIVGLGKIARDQHLPAIRGGGLFKLVGVVEQSGAGAEDVPVFPDLAGLLAALPEVRAVAICTPPQMRGPIARAALGAGLDVLLEKPPTATLSAFAGLRALARAHDRVLFAAWHSRFAPMVARARELLAARPPARVRMTWREDARKWHPGQHWLWEPGGLGVFDPAINGLSILTALFAHPIEVRDAAFEVPDGAATPIAAHLNLTMGDVPIECDLDFREVDGENWQIVFDLADGGQLALNAGGAGLSVDGIDEPVTRSGEYPKLYARFAELIAARASDADAAPLRLVADAFMLATTRTVARFDP